MLLEHKLASTRSVLLNGFENLSSAQRQLSSSPANLASSGTFAKGENTYPVMHGD
jgi:hypothetical protein